MKKREDDVVGTYFVVSSDKDLDMAVKETEDSRMVPKSLA